MRQHQLTDTEPGAVAFERLAEAVQDVQRWMPAGVADIELSLIPPRHDVRGPRYPRPTPEPAPPRIARSNYLTR